MVKLGLSELFQISALTFYAHLSTIHKRSGSMHAHCCCS